MSEEELIVLNNRAYIAPIHFLNDSNAPIIQETEDEIPALTNLSLESGYIDFGLLAACGEALSAYLKTIDDFNLDSDEIEDISDDALEHVNAGYTNIVDAVNQIVHYRGHQVELISSCRHPCTCCYIVPPYILEQIYQIDSLQQQVLDIETIETIAIDELQIGSLADHSVYQIKTKKKEPLICVYDGHNEEFLPGTTLMKNNQGVENDLDSAGKAIFKSAQTVNKFWLENFNRFSYDDAGSDVIATVHFGEDLGNAVWVPEYKQMLFGDGDDRLTNLTQLSVFAHEFGHGVTGERLDYYGEAGALNEHFSDVWGVLAVQYKNKQKADKASWLVGENVVVEGKKSYPLRSMKEPGSTSKWDLQPDHYSDRYIGELDNGGVHINSGIPNRAFYLFCKAQGGYAWEKPGHLWYKTLMEDNFIRPDATIPEFAHATLAMALKQYPKDYKMHKDLASAWRKVGVFIEAA